MIIIVKDLCETCAGINGAICLNLQSVRFAKSSDGLLLKKSFYLEW